MPTLSLAAKIGDAATYGLVTVFDANGGVARCFRITLPAYAALGQKNAREPAGVNPGERWVAAAKVLEVGNIRQELDGGLTIKLAESPTEGEAYVRLGSADYTGTVPLITLSPDAIAAINAKMPLRITVNSIINGIVTWRSR